MFRKLICLISFVAVLSAAGTASAELVAWWRFDDGSGTTAMDSSGNGNDGTLNGGATWTDGQLGGAIQFNGADSAVIAPYIPLNDQSFTIAMWVNPVLYTDQTVVFSQVQTNSQGLSMHYRLWGDGRVRMGYYSNDLDSVAGTVQDNNWYHIVFWHDVENQIRRIYVDGVQVAEDGGDPYHGASGDTRIGMWNNNQWFQGMIDDVQIYDHPLSDNEIQAVMRGLEGFPFASGANPKDGTLHADTWINLSWRAGDFAVSHDVYFSDSFDDVNDGGAAAFQGNQATAFLVAGFPGFPYPDGLVPGTTYYWRIDEVNDTEPNSPWAGPVWSFSVPPKKAYEPIPANDAKFLTADTTLSWTAGFGAKLHYVYFGNNFDEVNNATGALPQAATTFAPGPLEPEKTYYWRVDEFDVAETHKGDVWSFDTAKIGGGIKGQYFKGMNFENLVLTRTDPQIDFSWGNGEPDPLVGSDNFSCRWTGEVEAAFTETYTFYTNSDDGVRLWVDGQLIVENWTNHGNTENSGDIDLVAGQTYSLSMELYEDGGGAVAQLRWSSPSTPKQLVPQAALSPPVKANSPSPANGSDGAKLSQILKWGAGDDTASHDVYFGTDADAVANATNASPEFKGAKAIGDESFDPGKLAWFTQYFWRIDEVNGVNPDSPWTGNLWSFTTGDFLVVDNIEDYTDNDAAGEAIWQHWIDGFGIAANGSQAGYSMPPYAEQSTVHGGSQAMPLFYTNTGGVANSEVELKLDPASGNWTEESVGELSIWFQGQPASTGSFVEGPVGTFTMSGSGTDIWGSSDEFHFAYKTLTGTGAIIAKVESLTDTNNWAKAGVMIRETLEPGSKNAMVAVTIGNGVSSQWRTDAGAGSSNAAEGGITAPHWIKLERDIAGNFTASQSTDGNTWQMVGAFENIQMGSTVFVGLAVTSHNASETCEAVFSNVTITGSAAGQWMNQDIGIAVNAAEPLYVAVSNATGAPVVIAHPDPAAANADTWTEWAIPLSTFSDQGINLTNVDKIAIGLGSGSGVASSGGSGVMYIDDIRLYRPRP